MSSISITSFSGLRNKTSPRLLDPERAQIAENCQFQRGHLEPLRRPSAGEALSGKTVFKLGERWLTFAKDVDVAKSFVFAENKRFMWTGDEYPKVSDLTIWPGSKRLGVPKPSVAPSVEFIDNPNYVPPATTGEDTDPNAPDEVGIEVLRSCAYVYTAVNEWGEESAPSEPSPVVDVRANKIPRVINMRRPEKTGVTAVKFRIYRTVSGTSGASYQFVAEIDSTLSNYTDEQADADLGETCATVGYTPPPDDLQGLYSASNMLFGFRKNEVWVSEASIPYAWPEAYRINVEDDVVGIGGFGSTVVILTTTRPYVVTGVNPDALTISKAQFDMPCLSKKSIVSTEGAVLFASADGLIGVSGANSYTNLTKDIFTKEQWMVIGPSGVAGAYYDSKYYAFLSSGNWGVILHFDTEDATVFYLEGISVLSLHYSPSGDALYMYDGGRVYAWEGGEGLLPYHWKSKQFFSREPISLTCALVSGGEGNTMRFYQNGELFHETTVVSDEIMRLPAGNAGQIFEIELEGTAAVFEIGLATSTQELTGGASS